MKTGNHLQLVVILILVFCCACIAQMRDEQRKPFQISPLIGDTIDGAKREYFHLFPTVKNFRWAVFYLNPNGSLSARVVFGEGSRGRDSLIKYYGTLGSVRDYLKQLDAARGTSSGDRGANVTIELHRGGKLEGTLLAVRETTIVISPKGSQHLQKDVMPVGSIIVLRDAEIDKVVIEGHSHVVTGMGVGGALGCGLGYAFSISSRHSTGGKVADALQVVIQPAEDGLFMLVGLGIGMASGALIGAATSTSDKEFLPITDQNRLELRGFARYPFDEPDSVKNFR